MPPTLLSQLITLDHLVYLNLGSLLLFIIYELGYKKWLMKRFEWRIDKKIVQERFEIEEHIKAVSAKEIEAIKADNAKEIESLKHTLNKLLTLQVQHRTEERQALVNFLSSCNQWIFNLSRIKFDDFGIKNIDSLKTKISNIKDEYFLNIYVERLKILLFITNEQVNNSTRNLVDDIDRYKNDMENILNDLLNLLEEQWSSGYEVVDYDPDIGGFSYTHYDINNSSKIGALFIDYENFNGKSYGSCLKQIEDFAAVAKAYLTSSEFNKA